MELTYRMMFRLSILACALVSLVLFLGGCACDHPDWYAAEERECDGMPNVDGTEDQSPAPNERGTYQSIPGKSVLPPKLHNGAEEP